jgi:hypothetical protein
MAGSQDRQELLEKGKHWVEQMCGRSHDITEVHWNDHEDTAHLSYSFTLPPHKQRESVHLVFTLQELADCATDLSLRVQLRRRIQEALTPWLSPREQQDF